MTTLNADLRRLADLAANRPDLGVFLFGSVLREPERAYDIDLLVIYDNDRSLDAFRTDVEALRLSLPVDLIAMTDGEQAHYQFIDRSCAQLLATVFARP